MSPVLPSEHHSATCVMTCEEFHEKSFLAYWLFGHGHAICFVVIPFPLFICHSLFLLPIVLQLQNNHLSGELLNEMNATSAAWRLVEGNQFHWHCARASLLVSLLLLL